MELNRLSLLKRVLSAIVLTGVVMFAVLVTQPKAVDNPVNTPASIADYQPGTTEMAVYQPETTEIAAHQPRNYLTRPDTGSRAENPAKPADDFTYIVKKGDTLYDLAHKFRVSVEQIEAANNLATDKLSLEQKLLIPASGKVDAKPAEKPAKTTDKPRTKISAKVQLTAKVKTAAMDKPDAEPASTHRYTERVVGSLINWSKVQSILPRGGTATVIDVDTGYIFKIKRKGGTNHADCEPLTASDTAVMKKLYGAWSWNRRAIVVEVGGKMIAASMAGMPHGTQTISGNNFSGHFDIHFYGSKTHGSEYTHSRTPVVDPAHQAMVRKAAGL